MKEPYDYLSVREAVLRKGEEVNFYGAVSEYEHPKPTRGSGELKFNHPELCLFLLQTLKPFNFW